MYIICIYIYIHIFSSSSLWYQKSMIWIFWIHSSLNWATNQFDMSGRPLSTSSRHGWLPAASVAICRTGTRLIWWDAEVIATLKSQPGTQRHPAPLNQASVFQHFPTLPFHENLMILSWLSHVIPTPHKLSWHHGKKKKHQGSLRLLRLPLELQINCSCRPFKSLAPHWPCCLERTNCDLSMCSNHLKPIHYPIFFRCLFSLFPHSSGFPRLPIPNFLLSDPKLQDLSHWTAPIIGTTIKVIAVVISSYIQAVISAFYSGIRGGRLFGEAFGDPGTGDVGEKKGEPDGEVMGFWWCGCVPRTRFMYGVMPYISSHLRRSQNCEIFNCGCDDFRVFPVVSPSLWWFSLGRPLPAWVHGREELWSGWVTFSDIPVPVQLVSAMFIWKQD